MRGSIRKSVQNDDQSVQLLLDKGADKQLMNNHQQTCIFYAAMSNELILKHLLDSGDLDINSLDLDGNDLSDFSIRGLEVQQPDCHKEGSVENSTLQN